MAEKVQYIATGRRKNSIARVRLMPGEGKITVNARLFNAYFPRESNRLIIMQPLETAKSESKLDIFANVNGGGTTGQAGAVMLGIARALKKYDPILVQAMRDGGYLTRDSRMVERKKPGQSGARKRYQFSKR